MSITILPTEGTPIDIDGYLRLPAPGPEQPSAADESFPSVRLGRAMRRIVEHSINPLMLVCHPYEPSGNCAAAAGLPPTKNEAVVFEDVEPTVPSFPPRRLPPAEKHVIQFDTRYDWITRNVDGRRNVATPIKYLLDFETPSMPADS